MKNKLSFEVFLVFLNLVKFLIHLLYFIKFLNKFLYLTQFHKKSR